jgi:transcriptional regulator with XRE-family HTH domain
METFGEWLRQQREQLKLTRAQLAERVGCSVAWLRKIEDGERRWRGHKPILSKSL